MSFVFEISRRRTRLLGLIAATACATLLVACNKTPPPAAAPTSPQVGVHVVEAQRLTVSTELPGRTRARLIAEIRPQVGGIVQQRLFEEGTLVKAGQVLYQIDPAGFEASYASAQAGVAKAEATLVASRITAQRNAELVKIDAISQQQDDNAQATLKQAEADLAVARAAQQTARINLDRTRITAPISGRVDMSSVTPGALVTANQETALTTVQQLDPLVVDVVQSSNELLRLKRDLASGALQRKSADEAPINLRLEDGSAYAHTGRLQFSGVTVNPSTGAITLRALVPNPEGVLLPGMYVRAVLDTGVAEQALLVPQQGITRTPSGDASALVVGEGDKVERRKVSVDRAIGNRWQVTSGLKPGDRLIVDGLQRAKVGMVVRPVTVPVNDKPAGKSNDQGTDPAGNRGGATGDARDDARGRSVGNAPPPAGSASAASAGDAVMPPLAAASGVARR